jgi:hypothetical protein
LYRSFQVDRIPHYNGCYHQIEAGSTIALILETAVTQFTQSVKEYGAGQCILGFAFV